MKSYCIIIILLINHLINVVAQDKQQILSLTGKWKFAIGDEKERSQTNYNDNNWESINVPSAWENQGFYGYDGYAWYRRSVVVSSKYADKPLYIRLGYIDDVDQVYFNGHLIGYSGSFPPKYTTAYNAFREYYIPSQFVKFDGQNVIAVKVYDSQGEGGIVNGNVALCADMDPIPFDIKLEGVWKFTTGDRAEYKKPEFNDNNWSPITVPKTWDDQGYPSYDGYAWYRKKFLVTNQFGNENIVIMLGKIDDFEEVYLNGQYIGPVKTIAECNHWETNYNQIRAYYVSGKLLQPNKYNVIAVRVLDTGDKGGMYEGPVGIINLKSYLRYWRNK